VTFSPWLVAFLFGVLGAVSLPVGAIAGIRFQPSVRLTAAVMAFGAGALLAAMSFELVLPALERGGFAALATGFLVGCVLFVVLNHILNEKGGFLRKAATLAEYAGGLKRKELEETVRELAQVDIFRQLPPEEIQGLVPYVSHLRLHAGDTVFAQGDIGDALYIVEQGKVAIMRTEGGRANTLAHLGRGQSFGEMALLGGETRMASAIAVEPLSLGKILREDFRRLIDQSPALSDAVTSLSDERKTRTEALMTAEEWRKRAMHTLDSEAFQPSSEDIQEVIRTARARGAAGYAIWLGSVLDSAGEALVIGASTLGSVSFALVAGVFLANIPESMSSAATLRRQRMSARVIVGMWVLLVLLSGVLAALGNVMLAGASDTAFAFVEGLAAGAILAMIAQTMLPEAFEHGGGNAVSIMTAVGFLTAILVGLLTA
jgi:CRP-like cAMP-binding protein